MDDFNNSLPTIQEIEQNALKLFPTFAVTTGDAQYHNPITNEVEDMGIAGILLVHTEQLPFPLALMLSAEMLDSLREELENIADSVTFSSEITKIPTEVESVN